MEKKLKMLCCILLGNVLLAFGVCGFIVPNDFMLGGSTGIALVVQEFLPLRLSVISAFTNGLLFLLGLAFLGWKFAATSLLSTVLYPIVLAGMEALPLAKWCQGEPLLCALFGAVTMGGGIGLVIRNGGSTGGMDIPPCILQKYKNIPVGTSLLWFDSIILLTQILCKGMDGLLYSIFIVVVTSAAVNRTLVSGERKVEIIIISPEYEKIRQRILSEVASGVTMLSIETGYNRAEQKAVFCVVYAKKYPAVRDLALELDRQAFIVASEVSNVNGRGYTLAKTGEIY